LGKGGEFPDLDHRGFLALFSVAVLNQVVLVSNINLLRPVLITTLVAGIGFYRWPCQRKQAPTFSGH
jgi:hypothetical protein